MSATTAALIVSAVVVVDALVSWALLRRRAIRRRDSWVSLDALGPSDPSQTGGQAGVEADDDDSLSGDPDRSDGHSSGSDDEATDGPPKNVERLLAEALDGDDEVVALVGTDGEILAMSNEARRVLGGDIGRPFANFGRCRPVASAGSFDYDDHPVTRALAGEHLDGAPVVFETESSALTGLVTARPVDAGGATMALLILDLASPATRPSHPADR